MPSHQGVVVVFNAETGAPACVAEAGAITSIRTASASAMATDVLARSDARTLAILGTGEQALHHALAIPHVRMLDEIRIWGRSSERAQALAAEVAEKTGIAVRVFVQVAEAVSGADIVCTVAASTDPILLADSVRAQGAEFRHALNSGAVGESHLLGEIGEVLLGTVVGRQSDTDITIYKSLGHIIQDIASAEYIYAALKAQNS